MAAQTPPARDRVVDLVRGASLVVVVFGHSFMALVVFADGTTELGNTLAATPSLQLATWLLQVMPLFFAAGAWANALSYRSATGYPAWLNARVRRLVRPVIVYAGFWILLSPVLLAWNRDVALPLLRISTQLLWFLGAYLLVTALTPVLVRLSRHPVIATLGWLAAATTVDLVRLAGAPDALGLANFVLVWGLAGQCGLWAFSPARRPGRGRAALVALAAVSVNVALVAFGPWPRSLVGLPGEKISNMAPPSAVLALHCITLAALVVLAYGWLQKVAAHERVWRPTCVVNAAAMTIYLWHLAGLILAIETLSALGLDLPGFSTTGWAVAPLHVLGTLRALHGRAGRAHAAFRARPPPVVGLRAERSQAARLAVPGASHRQRHRGRRGRRRDPGPRGHGPGRVPLRREHAVRGVPLHAGAGDRRRARRGPAHPAAGGGRSPAGTVDLRGRRRTRTG